MKADLPQGLRNYEECDIETMWIHLVVWHLFVPKRFGEIKKITSNPVMQELEYTPQTGAPPASRCIRGYLEQRSCDE